LSDTARSVCSGAEAAPPERIREDHRPRVARNLIRAREEASKLRLYAEHREEVARGFDRIDALGRRLVAKVHRPRAESRDRLEGRHVVAHDGELPSADRLERVARAERRNVLPHHHDAFRLAKRQRRQQHRVDHVEHEHAGAQSKGERRHGGQRERPFTREPPKRVPNFLCDLLHADSPMLCAFGGCVGRAHVPPCFREVAELAGDDRERVALGHSARHEVGRAHIAMKCNLILEIAANLACGAPGQAEDAARLAVGPRRHMGSSTWKIAAA
jgi:hypothetical protein